MLSRDEAPTLVLHGDSHANHLYPGLVKALPQETVLSVGGCAPILGLRWEAPASEANPCRGAGADAQSRWVASNALGPSIRFVIVAAKWPAYDDDDAAERQAFMAGYVEGVRRQLSAVQGEGRTVILALDNPLLTYNPQRCGFGRADCSADRARLESRRRFFNSQMLAMLREHHPAVKVYDPLPAFCDATTCRMAGLLRDNDHLSKAGSNQLAADFVRWAEVNAPGLVNGREAGPSAAR
jgi:hypothetical protein